MTRPLSEQKVLKKLGIEDFRHLTKDKVITMVSMLDKMDPEVAKKALEQFPNFSETMTAILHDYKASLDKQLEENHESTMSFYDTCDSLIEALKKELDKDNHTFEEKKFIIDKMLEITKLKGDKDFENKKFHLALAVIGAVAVGVASSLLSSSLGNNIKIDLDDFKKLN